MPGISSYHVDVSHTRLPSHRIIMAPKRASLFPLKRERGNAIGDGRPIRRGVLGASALCRAADAFLEVDQACTSPPGDAKPPESDVMIGLRVVPPFGAIRRDRRPGVHSPTPGCPRTCASRHAGADASALEDEPVGDAHHFASARAGEAHGTTLYPAFPSAWSAR